VVALVVAVSTLHHATGAALQRDVGIGGAAVEKRLSMKMKFY